MKSLEKEFFGYLQDVQNMRFLQHWRAGYREKVKSALEKTQCRFNFFRAYFTNKLFVQCTFNWIKRGEKKMKIMVIDEIPDKCTIKCNYVKVQTVKIGKIFKFDVYCKLGNELLQICDNDPSLYYYEFRRCDICLDAEIRYKQCQ